MIRQTLGPVAIAHPGQVLETPITLSADASDETWVTFPGECSCGRNPRRPCCASQQQVHHRQRHRHELVSSRMNQRSTPTRPYDRPAPWPAVHATKNNQAEVPEDDAAANP